MIQKKKNIYMISMSKNISIEIYLFYIMIKWYNKIIMFDIKIYVLNASGGEFPVQLALLGEIYMAKKLIKKRFNGYRDYAPDLCLCCSGGNVASYIAMSGDWSPQGIKEKSYYMDSQMFITTWLPFLPTYLASAFTGSIYRQGYGSKPLFRNMFTPTSVQKSEIWTGTFDGCNAKEQLFCNKTENTSFIKNYPEKSPAYSLYNIMPFKYLNGNVDKIADASTASASVPILTQGHQIDEQKYSDGCIMYASTLIPLVPQIRDIVRNNDYKLQLIYFCSYNMDKSIGESRLLSIAQPIRALVHSSILKDRNSAVELLESLSCDITYEHYREVHTEKLSKILEKAENAKHYVLFIYPNEYNAVDMTCFNGIEIVDVIEKSKKCYGVHLWIAN